LGDIPLSGNTAVEYVSNSNIPNGHTEIHRPLSSHSRIGDSTENYQNDDSSIYDTGSDVTVVTRSLRTWDVAALIINKMVRIQKVSPSNEGYKNPKDIYN
jgi:hypothetical protein